MNSPQPHDTTWIATLLGTTGLALALLFAHDRMRRSAVGDEPGPQRIRNAGADEMKMPPREWDRIDETLDASFPASDPPGNY